MVGIIGILFLLLFGINSGSPAATQVYVSTATGSDLTGDGSMENPWASIGHAIDSVSGTAGDPYEILVAQGTYNENELDLGEYESILGGYNPDNWVRDIDAYPPSLMAGIPRATSSGEKTIARSRG
ncbi:MAG: hypothetical protein V1789_12450 [PVC group bacterium]